MKNTKYILLIILSFMLVNISKAQKSKPINSGFVFIDGKYIEPPYVVKIKETNIYINNLLVDTNHKIIKYKNPPKREILKKLPDLPPDTLTVREAINYINPKTNNPIYNDVFYYYYDKYDFNKATDLMLTYYLEVPTIKKHCIQTKPYIKLLAENGDTINISRGYKWEIKEHHTKKQINKSLKKRQKHVIERMQNKLKQGGCLFSNNNILINSSISRQEKSEYFIKEIIPIINDKTIPIENKINLLWGKYGFVKYGLKDLIEIGIQTDNLNDRIQFNANKRVK